MRGWPLQLGGRCTRARDREGGMSNPSDVEPAAWDSSAAGARPCLHRAWALKRLCQAILLCRRSCHTVRVKGRGSWAILASQLEGRTVGGEERYLGGQSKTQALQASYQQQACGLGGWRRLGAIAVEREKRAGCAAGETWNEIMGDQYLRNPCCLFAGDSRKLSRAGRDGTSTDQREFVPVQHSD